MLFGDGAGGLETVGHRPSRQRGARKQHPSAGNQWRQLGQQPGAVSLGHLQRTARLVQQFTGAHQRRRAPTPVDAVLERKVGVADRLHELAGNNRQSARGRYAARVVDLPGHQAIGKLDLVAALAGLLLFLPLLPFIAALVRLESKGPLFFGQERVGRYGKRFTCYKIRSMVPDAEARKEALQDLLPSDDPRITALRSRIERLDIIGWEPGEDGAAFSTDARLAVIERLAAPRIRISNSSTRSPA